MKKISILMSGGFFSFYAHAGFLKAVEETGITPDSLGGSSAGGLIGGIRAAGVSPDMIQEFLKNLRTADFFDLKWPWQVNLIEVVKKKSGLLKGESFKRYLSDLLPYHTFEESPHPCCMVAKDADTSELVVLQEGDLVNAIYAASAVPYMFEPSRENGRVLIDGGYTNKAPIQALYDLSHPDLIIVHYIQKNSKRHASLYQQYLAERESVERAGCSVIEIMLHEKTRVYPFLLGRGEKAMQEAHDNARRTLDVLL